MHRSITFTEMISSTFSNDNYDDVRDNNSKKQFLVRIGIGLIEFLTSTIFLSFGIFFSNNVSTYTYDVETGLWTTIILISASHITGPWARSFCSYSLNKGHHVFKYLVCLATIFLFCGLLMPGDVVCYGLFGGIFTNLIISQLKVVALNLFETELKIFEANLECGKALGLLIMPHLLLALVENYTMEQAKLIFSAMLLNIVPAVWIIRPPEVVPPNDPEFSRYKTLPALSMQMREMMEFTSKEFTSDMSYADSPDEDEYEAPVEPQPVTTIPTTSFDEGQVNPLQVCLLNSHNVKDYYCKAGVAILPEIPEEAEESQADDNSFIDPKRISRISAKLEELNQKYNNAEILNISDLVVSKTNIEETERIQTIEYIQNYKDNNIFLKDMERIKSSYYKCCCSCLTWRIFLWKRKFRFLKDFILDNFCKPLLTALRDPRFYPVLLSKVSVSLISMIYLTLAPYLALQKNEDFTKEDTAFLLSYVAFSWCMFLVLLPLVVTFDSRKLGSMYVCGHLLCGSSLILLFNTKVTNEFITFSCLLYGFGYGIVSYTETFIYRSYMGIRRWKPIEGTLETLFSFCVILVYYIIYTYQINIVQIFPIVASATYMINALIWTILPILSSIVVIKRSYTVSDLDASQSLQID